MNHDICDLSSYMVKELYRVVKVTKSGAFELMKHRWVSHIHKNNWKESVVWLVKEEETREIRSKNLVRSFSYDGKEDMLQISAEERSLRERAVSPVTMTLQTTWMDSLENQLCSSCQEPSVTHGFCALAWDPTQRTPWSPPASTWQWDVELSCFNLLNCSNLLFDPCMWPGMRVAFTKESRKWVFQMKSQLKGFLDSSSGA